MTDLNIGNIAGAPSNGSKQVQSKKGAGFGDVIKDAVHRVDNLEKDANRTIIDLLQGKADVHESMIALQKADISMRLFVTVRNKVLDAYREIMRMQF